MSGWEIVGLVVPVVLILCAIVGWSWRAQWRRDPERFKAGFRNMPRDFHGKGSGRH